MSRISARFLGLVVAGVACAAAPSAASVDYARRLDCTLMPDLLSARRWMHLYFWLPRTCYSLPKRLPFFWDAVCHIVRGERHFTDIKKRLGPLGVMEQLLPYSIKTAREQTA